MAKLSVKQRMGYSKRSRDARMRKHQGWIDDLQMASTKTGVKPPKKGAVEVIGG